MDAFSVREIFDSHDSCKWGICVRPGMGPDQGELDALSW